LTENPKCVYAKFSIFQDILPIFHGRSPMKDNCQTKIVNEGMHDLPSSTFTLIKICQWVSPNYLSGKYSFEI